MSHLDDVREGGWWVLQHHDPSASVEHRRAMGAVRAMPADPGDSETGIGPDGVGTYGDIQGGMLWLAKEDKRGGLHSWFLTGAGVVATSGAAGPADPKSAKTQTRAPSAGGQAWGPIYRNTFEADDWYQTKPLNGKPSWSDTVWPKGWAGLAATGTDEKAQHDLLFPSFWGLVSVNQAGDPKAGTQVFDLTEDGEPDKDRCARLQSHLAVLDMTPGGGGLTGKALAIQLGRGGRIDGGKGGAVFVDYDYSEIGGGAMDQGGPFTTGRGLCQHLLGKDADGKAIRPLHLCTNSLFVCSYGDAPLLFDPTPYAATTVPDTGIWQPVHLRLDKELFHQAGAAGGVGFWRWETSAQFYIPPPIGDPPPEPPPPGDGDPPPVGDPGGRTPTGDGGPGGGRTPTGEGLLPGGTGGAVVGGGGGPNGGLPEEFYDPPWGTSDGPLPNEFYDPPWEGQDSGLPDEYYDPPWGGRTPTSGSLGGTPAPSNAAGYGTGVIGDGSKPALPHSPSCIAVPNVVFKASATLSGSRALSGNPNLNQNDLKTWSDSPQVGQLEGWAKGTGAWDGFEKYLENNAWSWAAAIGGLLFLPPDVSMAKVLETPGEATTQSPLSVGIPAGLAKLDLGIPDRTSGFVPGFSLSQDPDTGTASLRNTDPDDGTPKGGLDVTTDGVVTSYDSSGNPTTLGASGLPTGYITGLQVNYDPSNSDTKVFVESGKCRNKADTGDLTLSAQANVSKSTANAALGYERRALTGTISVTTGNVNLVGTSTLFLSEFGTRSGTGTISTVGSSVDVSGTSTKFLSEVAVDDLVGNSTVGFSRVVAVLSDTSLTLDSALDFSATHTLTIVEQPTVFLTGETNARKVKTLTSNTAGTVVGGNWASNRTNVASYVGVPMASVWLYVWVLKGATGTTAAFSTQRTTPLLTISGYDQEYRRVGETRVNTAGNLQKSFASGSGPARTVYYQADTDLSDADELQVVSNASSLTSGYTIVDLHAAVPPGSRLCHLACHSISPNTPQDVYVVSELSLGSSSNYIPAPASSSARSDVTLAIPLEGNRRIGHATPVAGSDTGDGTYIDVVGYEVDL